MSANENTMKEKASERIRLSEIRLFATDVDGVLTDAGMYYSESGDEWKKFNTRDGMGIKLLQKAGYVTAIVTQERTKIVARRAEKLAIPELHQGVMDKLTVIREMAGRHGLSLHHPRRVSPRQTRPHWNPARSGTRRRLSSERGGAGRGLPSTAGAAPG